MWFSVWSLVCKASSKLRLILHKGCTDPSFNHRAAWGFNIIQARLASQDTHNLHGNRKWH